MPQGIRRITNEIVLLGWNTQFSYMLLEDNGWLEKKV